MSVVVLSPEQIQKKLLERSYAAQKSYLAMYSTWWGGIVKEPGLMVIPIDDHQVHRGDAVFEAIKVIDGKAFLFNEHLERLQASASQLGLALPMSLEEMRGIISETVKAAGVREAILRLFVSRGPGGFTTNPYDSVGAQFYLVVTHFAPVANEKYLSGVKVGRSHVAPKEPWFARIKSCNYLPNVMMKKESVDRKLDFTIGIDPQGFLTEGSTENIVLVDKNDILVRPKLHQILKGTTMMRTFELAEELIQEGLLSAISERDLSEQDVMQAKEVMMIGTTLDVLPVTEYEGQKIGQGTQGPVAARLLQLLREDIKKGPKSTPLAL